MLEELPYLSLFPFLSMSAECFYMPSKKKWSREYLLPSTSPYLDEEHFADFYVGWSEGGLFFRVESHKPFEKADSSEYKNGDAVELFIDTRDLKTKGITSFCHHFLFFPEKVGGYLGKEITQFRSSDMHSLSPPQDLLVKSELFSSSYRLEIEIPDTSLHGFSPSSFDRFGFSYRAHRFQGAPQHFSCSSHEFFLEQQPAFWCSMKLVKKEDS